MPVCKSGIEQKKKVEIEKQNNKELWKDDGFVKLPNNFHEKA
jgi:hypothetical protein